MQAGDIVKYKNPYPDENPDNEFTVIRVHINWKGNEEADIRLNNHKYTFAPTYSVETSELIKVEKP